MGRVIAFGCGEDEEGVPQTLPYKPEWAQRVEVRAFLVPEAPSGSAYPPLGARRPEPEFPIRGVLSLPEPPESPPAPLPAPQLPSRSARLREALPAHDALSSRDGIFLLRQELLLLPHHCHICHADARAPRARHPRHLRLAGGAGEDVRLLGLCSQCWPAAWAPGAWVSAPGPRPRGARGCGAHAETGLRGERDVGLTGVRSAGGGGRSGARGGLIAQGHRRSGEPGKRALA